MRPTTAHECSSSAGTSAEGDAAYEKRFPNKEAMKLFKSTFATRIVLVEHAITLPNLIAESFAFIYENFTSREWTYFISPPPKVYFEMVRAILTSLPLGRILSPCPLLFEASPFQLPLLTMTKFSRFLLFLTQSFLTLRVSLPPKRT